MRPLDRDRPGDPKTTGATHHLDDQPATKQTGAVCESSENHAVYAAGVLAYREAGWPGVIPAWGLGDKRPVRGFTGDKNYGVYPDDDQIVRWAAHSGDSNLLIRVTPTLIGLDIDAYGDKTGAKAMVEAENRWGALPADAWRSTSRIDCPNGSGIYVFKIPRAGVVAARSASPSWPSATWRSSSTTTAPFAPGRQSTPPPATSTAGSTGTAHWYPRAWCPPPTTTQSFRWSGSRGLPTPAGQFVLPDGSVVQPLRTPGGYRRFTLQMLRDIIVASTYQGWFSTEDTRFALHAVITASYRETGEYKPPS